MLKKFVCALLIGTRCLTGCGSKAPEDVSGETVTIDLENVDEEVVSELLTEYLGDASTMRVADMFIGTEVESDLVSVIETLEPLHLIAPKDSLSLTYTYYEYVETDENEGLLFIGALMNGYEIPMTDVEGDVIFSDVEGNVFMECSMDFYEDLFGVFQPNEAVVFMMVFPQGILTDKELAKTLASTQEEFEITFEYSCNGYEE